VVVVEMIETIARFGAYPEDLLCNRRQCLSLPEEVGSEVLRIEDPAGEAEIIGGRSPFLNAIPKIGASKIVVAAKIAAVMIGREAEQEPVVGGVVIAMEDHVFVPGNSGITVIGAEIIFLIIVRKLWLQS